MSDFISLTTVISKEKKAIRKSSIIEFHEDKLKHDGKEVKCVKVIYKDNLSNDSSSSAWVRVAETFDNIINELTSIDPPEKIISFVKDETDETR